MKLVSVFRAQQGFTLIEMIGVMAVIAILAAAATPKIFEAIEDAKVTAYMQEVQTIKQAVTRFYKDTGRWPTEIPSSNTNYYHQLMVNEGNSSGDPIRGWNGPYLDRDIANQITNGEYQYIHNSSDANYICDINGDGTSDGSFLVYRSDGVSDSVAKKISEIVDKDSSVTSGNNRWQASGYVKRYGSNSDHASILVHCLAKT